MTDLRCRLRLHQWRRVRKVYDYIEEGGDRFTKEGRRIYWEHEWACQRCHVHEFRTWAIGSTRPPYVPPAGKP